jgi:hypothetical protein
MATFKQAASLSRQLSRIMQACSQPDDAKQITAHHQQAVLMSLHHARVCNACALQ